MKSLKPMHVWPRRLIAVCRFLALYGVALIGALLVKIGRLGKLGMRLERWALTRLGVWAD
ncbi:MAG: hypothetical protein EBS42_15560 [Caulobacteraceae bacterium]|nr:hypothetical protein [Caulobacteraceae bacterium]